MGMQFLKKVTLKIIFQKECSMFALKKKSIFEIQSSNTSRHFPTIESIKKFFDELKHVQKNSQPFLLRNGLIENCSHKNQNSNIILLHSDLKKSLNPLNFLIIFHEYSQNEMVLIIYDLTNLRWGVKYYSSYTMYKHQLYDRPPCWLLVGNFMRNLSHKFASVVM